MTHQFGLFGYQKPKKKIPISKARIEEAKRLYNAGDQKGAAMKLREVRERLEDYEKRI